MTEYQSKQLSRRSKTREKRKIILIGCEGSNKTEKMYFSSFNNLQKEYVVKFSCGNDTDLAGILISIKKSEKDVGFETSKDKSFALFDIDNDSNKILIFEKLNKQKEYKNIKFIPSNPCFELWYLLHYFYTTKTFNSNKELFDELLKCIKDYDKSKNYFDMLFPNIESAIKNNKKLMKYVLENNKTKYLENSFTNVVDVVEIFYKAISETK